jgi:hypothetical protein
VQFVLPSPFKKKKKIRLFSSVVFRQAPVGHPDDLSPFYPSLSSSILLLKPQKKKKIPLSRISLILRV